MVAISNARSTREPLARAEDVAARLDVSTYCIWRLVRAGRIPAVKIGRFYRFDLEQIEQWLAAGGTAARG